MPRLQKKFLEARTLRKRGFSITAIGRQLTVSKSTLSVWLRDVELTPSQRKRLQARKRAALQQARIRAAHWHRQQRLQRLRQAELDAEQTLREINLRNVPTLELALAMLYAGEGFKKHGVTGLGNSDPAILKTFVCLLRQCYGVSIEQLHCQLHLRMDQNGSVEKKYWSRQLGIPAKRITSIAFDARTRNSKTFADYHGVCAVRVSPVAIQRKLLSIATQFSELVTRRA